MEEVEAAFQKELEAFVDLSAELVATYKVRGISI